MVKVEICNHTAAGRGKDYLSGTQLTFYKDEVAPGHYRIYICQPDFIPMDHDQSKNPCKPNDCKCGGFLSSDGYTIVIDDNTHTEVEGFYTE